MNTLKELQDTFQRAIVEGDDAVLAEIVDTSKEKRDVLFGVYRNAYVLRLIEFLSHDYEKLHAMLGDEQFDALARSYIAVHPSTTPNARWFGNRMPEFLRTESQYAATPVLADLASIEKALNDVFDAEEKPPLGMEDLAVLSPEGWAALAFTPQPSTLRIDMGTNADDIWSALHDEETPPAPVKTQEPVRILFTREDGMATFRALDPDEAMMWDEAADGVSFSVLCEMMAVFAGEEDAAPRAAGYLKAWIERGLLARQSPEA